jgi:alkyldihydroxyacetonephosphate synthase
VAFHHEDKPAFRPFVINAIDLDVNTTPTAPLSLEELPVPAPMISAELLDELTGAVGAENAIQMILTGLCTTYGKSVRDLLRLRAGDIPRVPDVVVYPADEAEVQLVVDYARRGGCGADPYGGG